MCDSAFGAGGHIILENGRKQPRPPKVKRPTTRPMNIEFTTEMAPIIGNLMDIRGQLSAQQQEALRELTGTAPHH